MHGKYYMVKINRGNGMTKYITGKVQTIERTVDKQRRRFRELLTQCGGLDRLAKRLAEVDEYFRTSEGNEKVRNAKRDLAGETAMTRILMAMEILAAQSASPTPSRVEKSLSKMGVYQPKYEATQRLKDKMQNAKPDKK